MGEEGETGVFYVAEVSEKQGKQAKPPNKKKKENNSTSTTLIETGPRQDKDKAKKGRAARKREEKGGQGRVTGIPGGNKKTTTPQGKKGGGIEGRRGKNVSRTSQKEGEKRRASPSGIKKVSNVGPWRGKKKHASGRREKSNDGRIVDEEKKEKEQGTPTMNKQKNTPKNPDGKKKR